MHRSSFLHALRSLACCVMLALALARLSAERSEETLRADREALLSFVESL